MKKIILFGVSLLILSSCNRIPNKPIYEELSISELEKAMKQDSTFGEFYDGLSRENLADKMSPSEKARFKGVTYRRIFKYVKYLNDYSHWFEMDSVWENDWRKEYAQEILKADSALAYWNAYREDIDKKMSAYVTVSLSGAYVRSEPDWEWNGYRTVETTRQYLQFDVNFTLADSIEKIDKIDYEVYWYKKYGSFSNTTTADAKNITKENPTSVYSTYKLPEDRPKKATIRKITIGDRVIEGYYPNKVPSKIRDYWESESKYDYEKLMKEYADSNFVGLWEYQRNRKDEALKKFDKLCFEFVEEYD